MGQKIPCNGALVVGTWVGMFPKFCYEDLNQKLKSFLKMSKLGDVVSKRYCNSSMSHTGV